MSTSAFIGVRVTSEMKALVRRLAENERITESALVKHLLEVVLRTSAVNALPSNDPHEKPYRDARLYVRLDPDDRALLISRAKDRGMRTATYVSVLVRSHLRNVTPLPREELLALRQSVSELRAIASNLNQMARALNQGGAEVPGAHEVMAMLRVAEALHGRVKALLLANERSWKQGYADEHR